MALAAERAARLDVPDPDPVWGDGFLDPLQFTLLLHAVLFSGSEESPARIFAAPISPLAGGTSPENFVKGRIRGVIAGKIGKELEVPLTKGQAAKASLCASLLLYGHKLTGAAQPNPIWHNDGVKPAVSKVEVALVFQDDYWNNYLEIDRWLLEKAGCVLPRQGPVAGKPVEWDATHLIPDHGSFDLTQSVTDDDGHAFATFRTVPETTPPNRRTFEHQRSVQGYVTARVSGLVPGWSRLEWIVTRLNPKTGAEADANLEVRYYDDTRAEDYRIRIAGSTTCCKKPQLSSRNRSIIRREQCLRTRRITESSRCIQR
jgi:hypothetical protein